jgi:hypothetical protein
MSDYVNAALVIGYDYQGLYLNDKLVCQGHRVDADDVLFYLQGKRLDSYVKRDCDSEWLDGMGGFPKDLADVEFA